MSQVPRALLGVVGMLRWVKAGAAFFEGLVAHHLGKLRRDLVGVHGQVASGIDLKALDPAIRGQIVGWVANGQRRFAQRRVIRGNHACHIGSAKVVHGA